MNDKLTLAEAAKEFGLKTTAGLRAALNDKRLKGEKRAKAWFVRRADVAKWIALQKDPHKPGRKADFD